MDNKTFKFYFRYVFSFKEKEKSDLMPKKGRKIKTLKNWDFLAALSNRRLSVQTLVHFYKLDWSIDRITIVGKLNYPIDVLGELLIDYGFAKETFNGYSLVDRFGENIAYFEQVKFYEDKGRIDFNPNKLGSYRDMNLQNFIHRLFENPHFSRADVACDIYNLPDNLLQQYQLADAVSYRPIYGLSGELETMYWGSRSSERQVRFYNKYIEQGRKNEYIPNEVKSWWRFEVQLRRAKANEWDKILSETLEKFCALEFMPDNLKATDKIMLTGLKANHNHWSILSRNSKYKYRKMLQEIAQEYDELTQELKKSFKEYQEDLKDELDSWLRGIDVTNSK